MKSLRLVGANFPAIAFSAPRSDKFFLFGGLLRPALAFFSPTVWLILPFRGAVCPKHTPSNPPKNEKYPARGAASPGTCFFSPTVWLILPFRGAACPKQAPVVFSSSRPHALSHAMSHADISLRRSATQRLSRHSPYVSGKKKRRL